MGKFSKYTIDIDLSMETKDLGSHYSYGTLESYGNTLEELIDNATVNVINSDGEDVAIREADSQWMQDLIEQEYKLLVAKYGD